MARTDSSTHVDVDALLLTDALDPASELRARAHLATCLACRARYQEQTLFLRALADAPSLPTRAEDEAVLRRALASVSGAGPSIATRAPAKPRSLVPAFAALAATVSLAVFLVVDAEGLRPAGAVLAATVITGSGARLDGAAVTKGTSWLSGARLEVAGDGLVEVELVRGGTLRIYPATSLSLSPRGERVDLARGTVWAIVDAGRGPFQVVTPQANARVLGTSFLVETRDDGTDVKVVEGRVQVTSTSGDHADAAVVVGGGERTRVSTNGAPEAPRRYDARDDRAQWQRFLDDLFARIGREIESGIKEVIKAFEKR